MEITVPHFILDSEDDSSCGTPSPVLSSSSSSFTGARVNPSDALPEWQCKYTGKICPEPRARKTNGKLHRMCEKHRVRANENQRRLQQKRREARAGRGSPYLLSPARAVEPLNPDWEDLVVSILKDDPELPAEPLAVPTAADPTAEPLSSPSQLTDEDVEVLTLLFTSSISSDSTDNQIYDVMCRAIHPEMS